MARVLVEQIRASGRKTVLHVGRIRVLDLLYCLYHVTLCAVVVLVL